MTVEYCGDEEEVLHAVLEADFDRKRLSPDFLEGKNKSVCRLKIYSRSQILAVFRRDLDRPGRSPPIGALQLNVGQIGRTSRAHFDKSKQEKKKPTLRVRIDFIFCNAAHAEIDGKITGGLSRELTKNPRIVREPIWLRATYAALRPLTAVTFLAEMLGP